MTWLAVAAVLALAATVAAFTRTLDRQARQHARERQLLLNQLLHATGKTWEPPPAEKPEPSAPREPVVREPVRYTARPEQFPDDPYVTE